MLLFVRKPFNYLYPQSAEYSGSFVKNINVVYVPSYWAESEQWLHSAIPQHNEILHCVQDDRVVVVVVSTGVSSHLTMHGSVLRRCIITP